jgi:DNA-binding CsgD family transcriptional regulator
MITALSLLRSGGDTLQIAKILGCKEHTAYNEIHRLREEERAKGYEKPDRLKIPYAGRKK